MNKFDYIDYGQMGACPAPWSSMDEGELWLADEYFMTLQKFPYSKNCFTEENEEISPFEMPVIYPYAMLVYHKIDRRYPHPLPIFALTLEVAYLCDELGKILNADLDMEIPDLDRPDDWSPIFFCMFQGNRHYNLGFYNNELGIDAVRESFFKKISSILYLKSRPRKAGRMLNAFGHPETGLELSY